MGAWSPEGCPSRRGGGSAGALPADGPPGPVGSPARGSHLVSMSFVSVAPDSDFPIQNLPYGVFSTAANVSRGRGRATPHLGPLPRDPSPSARASPRRLHAPRSPGGPRGAPGAPGGRAALHRRSGSCARAGPRCLCRFACENEMQTGVPRRAGVSLAPRGHRGRPFPRLSRPQAGGTLGPRDADAPCRPGLTGRGAGVPPTPFGATNPTFPACGQPSDLPTLRHAG